ncbi:hypothetical protein KQX54_010666, partial [Cotesia glomerata]
MYLKGFDTGRTDRQAENGGEFAILLRNTFKYSVIRGIWYCNNKVEVCGVRLFTANGSITIISCYSPPHASYAVDRNEWARFFGQFDGQFWIAGDFNMYHSLSGGLSDCKNGKTLVEVLEGRE